MVLRQGRPHERVAGALEAAPLVALVADAVADRLQPLGDEVAHEVDGDLAAVVEPGAVVQPLPRLRAGDLGGTVRPSSPRPGRAARARGGAARRRGAGARPGPARRGSAPGRPAGGARARWSCRSTCPWCTSATVQGGWVTKLSTDGSLFLPSGTVRPARTMVNCWPPAPRSWRHRTRLLQCCHAARSRCRRTKDHRPGRVPPGAEILTHEGVADLFEVPGAAIDPFHAAVREQAVLEHHLLAASRAPPARPTASPARWTPAPRESASSASTPTWTEAPPPGPVTAQVEAATSGRGFTAASPRSAV